MDEFAGLVATKKDEFKDHLAKLDQLEESTDSAKSTVNVVFDAIMASVEAQRTEVYRNFLKA